MTSNVSMRRMRTMSDIDLHHKRVLMRVDYNVPIKNGAIVSDVRIRATVPSIRMALERGAALLLMSHLGNPTAKNHSRQGSSNSLSIVAERLSAVLGQSVPLVEMHEVAVSPGHIALLENVRFHRGEKENDPALAKQFAALCDIYVMNAFATAHRSHASTCGIAHHAPLSCIGPLVVEELTQLQRVVAHPSRPVVAIVGGAKISTKLAMLEKLATQVDHLLIGGGMANTFFAAQGYAIGQSIVEPNLVHHAQTILQHPSVVVPQNVIVGNKISDQVSTAVRCLGRDTIRHDESIFDLAPCDAERWGDIIRQAQTIIWNGPVGVFECPAYRHGTETIARAVADNQGFSVAGGGDTIAAIESFDIAEKVSYISTGGGAFLQFMQNEPLPALVAIEASSPRA